MREREREMERWIERERERERGREREIEGLIMIICPTDRAGQCLSMSSAYCILDSHDSQEYIFFFF